MRYSNTPTLDIYFRQPLKELIAEGRLRTSKRVIERIGPHSFTANGCAVIIRYATADELEKIGRLKPLRCYYLIDDDLEAARYDRGLPDDYRRRLTKFSLEKLPQILALADTIVAPNPLVFRAYPDKTHLLLNPTHSSLCRGFSHFDQPSTFNILFSGTRSHLHDLELIAEAIADICRHYRHVRFTTFLGKHAPSSLREPDNVIHKKPLKWPGFKRIMQKEVFHIALAPYRDTPFNRARSINKILDHAAFGAAGIYSNRSPLSDRIEHGNNGLLVEDDSKNWKSQIQHLIENRQVAKSLAINGHNLAQQIGDPVHARQFWIDQLFGSEATAESLRQ